MDLAGTAGTCGPTLYTEQEQTRGVEVEGWWRRVKHKKDRALADRPLFYTLSAFTLTRLRARPHDPLAQKQPSSAVCGAKPELAEQLPFDRHGLKMYHGIIFCSSCNLCVFIDFTSSVRTPTSKSGRSNPTIFANKFYSYFSSWIRL